MSTAVLPGSAGRHDAASRAGRGLDILLSSEDTGGTAAVIDCRVPAATGGRLRLAAGRPPLLPAGELLRLPAYHRGRCPVKAYVSSTFADLKACRAEVSLALRRLGTSVYCEETNLRGRAGWT